MNLCMKRIDNGQHLQERFDFSRNQMTFILCAATGTNLFLFVHRHRSKYISTLSHVLYLNLKKIFEILIELIHLGHSMEEIFKDTA